MKGRGAIIFCLMVILLAGLSIVGEDNSVEATPTAYFTYLPEDPVVDEVIKFDASLSSGEGLQYKWIFENGHEPTGMVVEHTFRTYGHHNVILIVTNSTGGMDTHSKNIYVADEMDPAVGIVMLGFLLVYFLFYFLIILFYVLFIFFIALFYALNPIIGGILAYKMYKGAKKDDHMDIAKPYLIAHLVAGGISVYMVYFCLFSVIAHIVIYRLYKGKVKEMEAKRSKKKKKKRKAPNSQPPKVLSKPPESPPTPHATARPQPPPEPQPQTPR